MIETDSLPSEVAICAPRRGSQIRFHYFHYYGASHPWLTAGSGWAPPADLFETDDEFVLEINLAGIDPNDVHVEIRGNAIVVSGERSEQDSSAVRCYHIMEIERGPFIRAMELPVPVDPSSARAEAHHGLLVVHVHKQQGVNIHGCYSADSMEGLE
jgi:HSP20 family protein